MSMLEVRAPNADEQALKQSMLQACLDARALLMVQQPFTARLLLRLNLVPVVDDRLPTAATDGEAIFFNAQFMARRSDTDRRFILAHEVWHCALAHLRRRQSRDATLWNQACDHEVNLLLQAELGSCPDDALCDPAFRGLAAETIYARLQSREKRGKPLASPGRRVIDVHDADATRDAPASVMDPDYTPGRQAASPAMAERWQRHLISAAQQHAQQNLHGRLPEHLEQVIRPLRQATVAWQTVLAGYLQRFTGGGHRSWLPPARRSIHAGLYLPRRQGQRLSLAVAMDCSGSCLGDAPRFLSELRRLLGAFDAVRLRLLQFDTTLRSDTLLTEHDLHQLDALTTTGWGGTDLRVPFDHLAASPPDVLVVLTDGYGPAPQQAPGWPVLWVLTDGGRRPVDWGQVVQLDADREAPPQSAHSAFSAKRIASNGAI